MVVALAGKPVTFDTDTPAASADAAGAADSADAEAASGSAGAVSVVSAAPMLSVSIFAHRIDSGSSARSLFSPSESASDAMSTVPKLPPL